MNNSDFSLIEFRGGDIEYVVCRGSLEKCEASMIEYKCWQAAEGPHTFFADYHNGNGEPYDYVIRPVTD